MWTKRLFQWLGSNGCGSGVIHIILFFSLSLFCLFVQFSGLVPLPRPLFLPCTLWLYKLSIFSGYIMKHLYSSVLSTTSHVCSLYLLPFPFQSIVIISHSLFFLDRIYQGWVEGIIHHPRGFHLSFAFILVHLFYFLKSLSIYDFINTLLSKSILTCC